MSARTDRETVVEVRCGQHRRGRHLCCARKRARIRSARCDRRKLPFKCEIMICPAGEIIKLASKDPFSRQPSGPDITRFVNVLAKRLPSPPTLPLSLPSDDNWLLKVIAIEGRFVLGLYRRQMKAISYLGKVEKVLGVPATNRNWNTIKKGRRNS